MRVTEESDFQPITIVIETEAEFRELWHYANMWPLAIEKYDYEVDLTPFDLWDALDEIAKKRGIKFVDKEGFTFDS